MSEPSATNTITKLVTLLLSTIRCNALRFSVIALQINASQMSHHWFSRAFLACNACIETSSLSFSNFRQLTNQSILINKFPLHSNALSQLFLFSNTKTLHGNFIASEFSVCESPFSSVRTTTCFLSRTDALGTSRPDVVSLLELVRPSLYPH